MRDFAYATPSTIEEAVALLSEKWGEAEIMAGGTDLVTCLKQGLTSPARVVSLKGIAGLSGISTEGDSIKIGATTKLREFYARVRPGGPGWRAIVSTAGTDARIGGGLLVWALGCVVVYLGLFGIGGIVLGRYWQGGIAVVVALALTIWLVTATESGPGTEATKVRVV